MVTSANISSISVGLQHEERNNEGIQETEMVVAQGCNRKQGRSLRTSLDNKKAQEV